MTGPEKSLRSGTPAGSPDKGEPVFLVVGKIRRPHGVRGEMVMEVETDFPERLKSGVVLYVGEEHRPLTLTGCRANDTTLLVSFRGYSSPEAAGELRNQLVFVRADDRPPLPEGEYYHHQLIGMRVEDESGEFLGELVQILETGANDVYLIRPRQGPEFLIPAIQSVVLEISVENRVMRIHLLPGLVPE